MATDHIVKSYDQEITLLTRQVLEMGGLVEHPIASAIDALVKRSVEVAARVVERRRPDRPDGGRDRPAADPPARDPPADGGRPAV